MPMRITDTIRNAAIDTMADAVDAGATNPNGVMELWSGSPPGSLDGAPAGTLLGTIDFQNPAFNAGGTTNPGEAEALGTPLATTGANNGTIGFVRILDRDGLDVDTIWDDDDVGTVGTERVVFNTLTVSTGVDIELTSYTLSAAPQA